MDGFIVHEVQSDNSRYYSSRRVVLRLSVNLKELGKLFASHLNFQKLLMEEILHQIIDTLCHYLQGR